MVPSRWIGRHSGAKVMEISCRVLCERRHRLDLTLESALSPGGLVGHFAYVLLVGSMLMRDITYLRIVVILSALVAIAYGAIWLNDPVTVFWEALLVCVNVVQIFLVWHGNRRARFSPAEQMLVDSKLTGLSRRDARRLLNLGLWVDGAPGTELTREGEPVAHLVFLQSGRVTINVDDHQVGSCGPGNFVGEMSLLGDTPASATAVVSEPSHYWMISTDRVRSLRTTHPELAAAIKMGIAHDMKTKIIAINTGTASDPQTF